jgi:hypothetical protein
VVAAHHPPATDNILELHGFTVPARPARP